MTTPTPVYTLPTDPPAPVAVPAPPPAPHEEEAVRCDDGQVYVPGQWDWAGEWVWCSGYCALARAGYAYVPSRYQDGVYLRGYFAELEGARPLAGLKPSYWRYVHPPELIMGPPRRRTYVEPPQVQQPSPPPAYFWGSPFGFRPRRSFGWTAPVRLGGGGGTAERPPAPPRGFGERP